MEVGKDPGAAVAFLHEAASALLLGRIGAGTFATHIGFVIFRF